MTTATHTAPRTAKPTAPTKDAPRKELTTAQFAEWQITRILAAPGSAQSADHLMALLCCVEVVPEINGKLMRSKALKGSATDTGVSHGRLTVKRSVEKVLTVRDAKTAASCLKRLLSAIDAEPDIIDEALDCVTARIAKSVKKKRRQLH